MGSTPVPRTILSAGRWASLMNEPATGSKTMKTYLPWILTAIALGGGWFFHAAGKSQSMTLAKLEQELQGLEAVRAENAELKANQVSVQELERLRKDNLDLLRLRNEIRQLRDANQQLRQQAAVAQTEVQRAQDRTRAAQLQALATNLPSAAPQMSPEMVAAFQRRYGIAPTPQPEPVSACIRNLQTIHGAKRQWALENKQSDDVIPGAGDLLEFFKDNTVPQCPAGGQYTLNAVAVPPVCTIPGHVLPAE